MRDEPKKPIEDFEDILSYVGGWGRFQYMITIVNFLFNIFLGYVYLSPILTVYTPPHWCQAVWSTLIGRGMSRLGSHWSRVLLAPALLCHKEPARSKQNTP